MQRHLPLPSLIRSTNETLLFLALTFATCQAQRVFINEFHYDNSGSDVGEFVELLAPAGTDLGNYDLAFYNGANGQTYRTTTLSGIVTDEGGTGVGARAFEINGIQNGAPDGIALVERSTGEVLEFLSYEGAFTASSGVASGLVSVELPVFESSSVPVGRSLQRQGEGNLATDFAWQRPAVSSPGAINANQSITGDIASFISVTASANLLAETAGPEAVTLTIRLIPAPGEPVSFTLANDAPRRLIAPSDLEVPPSGLLQLKLDVVDNAVIDDTSAASLTLTDTSGIREPMTVEITLLDDDRANVAFEGDLRVATFNILNGVGRSGSDSFEAIKAIVARVNPDVITFQEVSSVNDFGQLKALLSELGYLIDRQFLALLGDGFENAAAVNGQFTSDQFIAIASRYPITRTVQIGRGISSRRELTRYPLYVEIDIPGLENDLAFVAVHLKAGRSQEDQFRKRVEAYRIVEFLEAQDKDGATDPIILLGDFNENREGSQFQTSRFTLPPRFSDGSSLPASYRLGNDLAENVPFLTYRTFPDRAFQGSGFRVIDARHVNGSDNGTFIDEGTDSDSALDYILVSNAIRSHSIPQAEVLNSVLDQAFDGLPKLGDSLAPGSDRQASDHRLVFADLALIPKQDVEITLTDTSISELDPAITGRMSLTEPLKEDLTGSLTLTRPSIANVSPEQWTIPAGALESAAFTFTPRPDLIPQPDYQVTLIATTTTNRRVGNTAITVRNAEPSSKVLISQYREPPSGAAGRAIELYHSSDELIDLSQTPLALYRYADGNTRRTLETEVTVGLWRPGQVVVIGDSTISRFLQSTGFLPMNTSPTSTGTRGAAFLDRDQNLLFVLDNLGFRGGDALEVQLGWERADVFGQIGNDPGVAWTANGVTTMDSNLTLNPLAPFGSTGFQDPSSRFSHVEEATVLEGFGIAPTIDNTYLQWAQEASLPIRARGLANDPDSDGFTNFMEFAFQLNPTRPSPNPLRLEGETLVWSEHPTAPINYTIESSQDLRTWQPRTTNAPTTANAPSTYYRVRATQP